VGSVVTAQRKLGFGCSKLSGFCSLGQPALESSKTPPPTHRGTGRITVDAREKGLTGVMMPLGPCYMQGTALYPGFVASCARPVEQAIYS